MTKKEREQLKLNQLLQECIDEQKAIGLHPADNIEIYIQKDPITGLSCPNDIYGYGGVHIPTGRRIILIRRKCFDKYPKNELKSLVHHELIHLNLKNDGLIIQHIDDWDLFTELANKIYKTYNINPLEKYSLACFEKKNSIPRYNCTSICPRCGLKSHYVINNDIEYSFDGKCSNCGHDFTYEKS